MTQAEMVLNHLQECGTITPVTAFAEYGVLRLSAIIYNLRHSGYNISTLYQTRKNRHGHKVTYAVYKLEN